MCGICGFSGVGGEHDLSRMMSAMPYRGPDGKGQWHDHNGTYLGHLRLAIVDLESGDQPLVTTDGSLVVVFNGEIYNHRILRKELEALGHKFQTSHCDTEILLHGYRQWGIDLTSRMNGMWAFALLDRKIGQLWLSRDRFGKKPLYYSQKNENFVFSSELSSLAFHPIVEPVIDRLSLKKYFAYGYVPAPRSMLLGVNKLPAGHNLVFDQSTRTSKLTRYWRLELESDESFQSKPQELGEQIINRLTKAVESRLEADVPVGVFVSGGIDSSTIATIAAAINPGTSLRTFSIGFEESSFDETKYANEIASLLHSSHRSELLSPAKCLELLPSILDRLDEPLGDSSLVPSFLMCQLGRSEMTVALGGDGSDELFAGYDPFKALMPAKLYSSTVPKCLHRMFARLVGKIPVSHKNMSFDFKMKKFFSALEYAPPYRNPIWLAPLPPHHLANLFGESIDLEELYSEAIEAWNYPQSENSIDRTLQFYTELYLQNNILTKMDRAGMLNSLEVRSPFLDYDFVDLVRRIPARLKYTTGHTKKVLKDSVSSMLPPEIVHRQKKGFGIPVGTWFKDRSLIINKNRLSNYLCAEYVGQLESEHLANNMDWRSFLWAHLVLEHWLDRLENIRPTS